jgi:adenosylhomocysteine nucleosidase
MTGRREFIRASLAAVIAAGCATRRAAAGSRRLYAILSAYEPETKANHDALVGRREPDRVETVHGVPFEFARFEGRDVILFPTGVSMVNAAMTTQLALERFPVTHVLFAGIAGGVNPSRNIGDVVVPDRWANHSEAAYFNPKPDGSGYVIDPAFPTSLPNFGWLFPADTWAVRDGVGKPQPQPAFPADPALLAAARRAFAKPQGLVFDGRPCTATVGGTGVSGPVYVDHRAYREWIFNVWRAECLDMESAAVAQVCWAARIPCLVVRALSDLAGGQEGVNPSSQNESTVSLNAASALRAVLRELPASG